MLPLDEFTTARNDAVKRLKKAGEDEAADRVEGLTKPSVPVWTINQLARADKTGMRALLDAAAKLRKAQERALGGGGSDPLRTAQAQERDALRDLTAKPARSSRRRAGRRARPRSSGSARRSARPRSQSRPATR